MLEKIFIILVLFFSVGAYFWMDELIALMNSF